MPAELKQKTVTITARKDLISKEGKQPYFTGEFDTGVRWACYKVNLFDSLAVGAMVEIEYRDGPYTPIIEGIVVPAHIPGEQIPIPALVPTPQKVSPPQKTVPIAVDSRNRSIEKQVALKAAIELAVAGKIVIDKVLIFAELYDRWLNGQLTFGDGWDAKIAEYALLISSRTTPPPKETA